MGNVVEELRARDLLDVATDIARELHLTVDEMFSPGGWSYPRIAKLVGKKDHATVMRAVQRFGVRRAA